MAETIPSLKIGLPEPTASIDWTATSAAASACSSAPSPRSTRLKQRAKEARLWMSSVASAYGAARSIIRRASTRSPRLTCTSTA